MTAIPAPPPSESLLDSFFVQTGVLAREAKKSSAALVLVGPTDGYFQRAAAKARFMMSAVSAVRVMKDSVKSIEDSADWFNQFCSEIDETENYGVERINKVLARIDDSQDSLRTLRASIERSIPLLKQSAISHKMRASRIEVARRLEKAVVANFSALENVRWALLEMQADYDISAGKVSEAYSSVEDLFASLKK